VYLYFNSNQVQRPEFLSWLGARLMILSFIYLLPLKLKLALDTNSHPSS